MVLVDTSIWIDFFVGKPSAAGLEHLLAQKLVRIHSMILGELAMGHLGKKRKAVLEDLKTLELLPTLPDQEVLEFIETAKLYASGLSWVDAHLLYTALMEEQSLWTADKRLKRMVQKFKLSYDQPFAH